MKDWNISKVMNMSFMFFGCENLEEIPEPFSDENKIKNKDISYIDYNCNNLKESKFFREKFEDKTEVKEEKQEIKEEKQEIKNLVNTQKSKGKIHNFFTKIFSDDFIRTMNI